MNKLFILFITLLVVAGVSCNRRNKKTLTILKVTEHGSAKVTDTAITKVLENELDMKIKIIYNLEEDVALNDLKDRSIDMAIIPSNTMIAGDSVLVRTVMPLLPRLLMVVVKPGTEAPGLKDLLENNVVLYEDMSAMDSVFFKKLFVNFNINPQKVKSETGTLSFEPGQGGPSVYVGLSHLHNPLVLKLLKKGWTFFSLDDVSNYGKGSSAEGIQMSFPWADPFILPASFYEGQPEKPVLTVAIRDVVVTRDDFDDQIVFEFVKTIYENRSTLVRINNIYNLLQKDFRPTIYLFPFTMAQFNTLTVINHPFG